MASGWPRSQVGALLNVLQRAPAASPARPRPNIEKKKKRHPRPKHLAQPLAAGLPAGLHLSRTTSVRLYRPPSGLRLMPRARRHALLAGLYNGWGYSLSFRWALSSPRFSAGWRLVPLHRGARRSDGFPRGGGALPPGRHGSAGFQWLSQPVFFQAGPVSMKWPARFSHGPERIRGSPVGGPGT